jgi:hypothetical protein
MFDSAQVIFVRLQRVLGKCATVDVVEQLTRRSLASQFSAVFSCCPNESKRVITAKW